jgi:hypothetical protein
MGLLARRRELSKVVGQLLHLHEREDGANKAIRANNHYRAVLADAVRGVGRPTNFAGRIETVKNDSVCLSTIEYAR